MNSKCIFYNSILAVATWALLFSCGEPRERVPTYSWSSVNINPQITQSDDIEAIISPYRSKLDSVMNEVIGYAAHDLTEEGLYESTLGTFVTDLVLRQSEETYDKEVDVVIMNHHGGLRAPINQGPITLGEVFEVMPFENEVLLLEATGENLLEIIDYIVNARHSMIWPVSFHVSDKGAESILIDGKELIKNKSYVIATNDYVANGGSGFRMLKPLKRLEINSVRLRNMIELEIRQKTAQGDSIQKEVSNLITTSVQ